MDWKHYECRCLSLTKKNTKYVRDISDINVSGGAPCWSVHDKDKNISEQLLAIFIDNVNVITMDYESDSVHSWSSAAEEEEEEGEEEEESEEGVSEMMNTVAIHACETGSHCAFKVNNQNNFIVHCWSDATTQGHLIQCINVVGCTAFYACNVASNPKAPDVCFALPLFVHNLGERMNLGLYQYNQERLQNSDTGITTMTSTFYVVPLDKAIYKCVKIQPIYYDVSSSTTSQL